MNKCVLGGERWEGHRPVGDLGQDGNLHRLRATQHVNASELTSPEVLGWRGELLCPRIAWLTDGAEKLQATTLGSH